MQQLNLHIITKCQIAQSMQTGNVIHRFYTLALTHRIIFTPHWLLVIICKLYTKHNHPGIRLQWELFVKFSCFRALKKSNLFKKRILLWCNGLRNSRLFCSTSTTVLSINYTFIEINRRTS